MTLFLDAVGIGIVFPIMPELMQQVGAGSTADGALWGGILMAAYAGAQFLFAPIIGGISDSIGRRPVLLLALAVLAVDYVVMALATSFQWLLAGRILAGMAGATYVTATAYVADISSKNRRAANFGLVGAAFGLGFILGPAIGGLAATWHLRAPFWLAAALAGANVVFGLFVLPESLARHERRAFQRHDLNPFGSITAALRLPGLLVPLLLLFLFEFANMVYPVLWSFWTKEMFGWNAALIGLSLAVYGGCVTLTQGVLLGRLVARVGEGRVLRFALMCSVAAFIAFGLTGSVWVMSVFILVSALADMAPPTMTAILSNMVEDDRQGLLQGVIAALGAIAAVVAPILMTGLFQTFASAQAPLYLPGAPFLLSGLLVLAALPLYWRLKPARG